MLERSPFPHAIEDGIFPSDVVAQAESEFPAWGHPAWSVFWNERELKGICNNMEAMGPSVKTLLHLMCRSEFIRKLEALMGIPNLIPDLHGGGMHIVPLGGKLGMHTDFNRGINGYRRLNGLLFLNSSWGGGGDLELWSKDKTTKVKIAPLANRFVVFETSSRSFHGHPYPLACPPDRCRKSLAVYYFTKEPPADVDEPRDTVFLEA